MQLKRKKTVILKKFIYLTLFILQRKRILDHRFCICSAQISLTYLTPIKSWGQVTDPDKRCSSVLKTLAMEKAFISASKISYEYHKRFIVNLENLLASILIWAWLSAVLVDIPFSIHLTCVTLPTQNLFQSSLS